MTYPAPRVSLIQGARTYSLPRGVRAMREAVLHHLATYFDAPPYQVELYDHKVVDHLTTNSKALESFAKGDAVAKWDIYRSIKYFDPV